MTGDFSVHGGVSDILISSKLLPVFSNAGFIRMPNGGIVFAFASIKCS